MIRNRYIRTAALVSAAVSLTVGSVAAQSAPAAGASSSPLLALGARFGAASTELAMDYQTPSFPRVAPIGGLFLELRLLSFLSLSADALYAEYGGKAVDPEALFGSTPAPGLVLFGIALPQAQGTHPVLKNLNQMNVKIQALEFPVQAKLSLPRVGGNVAPYISGGASIATFLTTISHNYRRVQWGSTTTSTAIVRRIEVDIADAMQSTDFAALGAAGITVQGRQASWSLEAFYRMGLSDVNKGRVLGTTGYTSNAVGVKVGISSR